MPQSGSQFSPELFPVAASRPWGTQTSMNLQEQWGKLAPLRIRTGCRAWGLTALVTHTLYLLSLTFSPLFEFPSGPGLGTVGPLVFGLRQAGLRLSHVASGGASLVAKALSPCPDAPWHAGSAAGPPDQLPEAPQPAGSHPGGVWEQSRKNSNPAGRQPGDPSSLADLYSILVFQE